MEYKHINLDRLEANCAGDVSMKKELLNMGIDTINMSNQKIKEFLNKQDFDNLAKTLHQLRPILSYCGVVHYLKNIETTEQDIINNKYCDPDGFIRELQTYLTDSVVEINNLLSEL